MKTPKDIEALMPAMAGEFRPFAFFDDRLDCIRVVTRDCSVYEKRLDKRFTILIDNYHEETGRGRKYVGFTIKGARHFCLEHHIPIGMPIKIGQLADAILVSMPEFGELFIDVLVKPLSDDGIVEVSVPAMAGAY